MWPSSVKEKLRRGNSTNTASSLTSSSSTSSSSSSSIAPISPFSQPTEDVWKDIRLSSLNFNVNHSSSSSSANDNNLNVNAATTFSPVIFQDFFVKESMMTVGSSSTRCVPPAPSPAATFLSLNPGAIAPDFHRLFGNSSSSEKHHQQQQQTPQSLQSDPGFMVSSGGGLNAKRDLEPSSDSPGDHRHKRMIKNRESASRSRARKQAYTNELELAVSNLKKENATLKEQLNQFHFAAAAQQYSRKQPLKRTSTAPF